MTWRWGWGHCLILMCVYATGNQQTETNPLLGCSGRTDLLKVLVTAVTDSFAQVRARDLPTPSR